MTDRAIARLRTLIPMLWGAALTALASWLLAHGAPAELVVLLDEFRPLGTLVLVPLAAGLVYEAARWLERKPWMPAWAIRILLGSTRQPRYPSDGTAP